MRLGSSKKKKKTMSKPTNILGWILFILDLAIALLPKVKQLAKLAKDDVDEDQPNNLLGWLLLSCQLVVKMLPTIRDSRAIIEDAFDDYELSGDSASLQ